MAHHQDIQAFAPTYESLAALYAAVRSIGPTLDLEEVLQQIIKAAVDLVEAEWGFIAWEPEQGAAVRACAVLSPDDIEDPALELALCATEPQTGQTPGSRAYIALPLWSPEETVCALYLDRALDRGVFSDADLKLLQAFADQAAVAIQNAYAVHEDAASEVEFVSMIAHDLRLPTTNVRGYSDILLREMVGPLSDQQKSFVSIIHNNTYYMETLTYNLSDIAKIDHNHMPLKPIPLSLEDSFNAVLEKLRAKIEEKEQTLQLDLPTLPNVTADKARLEQVVRVVLENAHLYTPVGGTITVAAEVQDGFVRLVVT